MSMSTMTQLRVNAGRGLLALLVTVLMFAGCAYAQQVVLLKDARIHSEPRFDAAVLETLPINTAGVVVAKHGPWLQVTVNDTTGWLLTTDIRFGPISRENDAGMAPPSPLERMPGVTATGTVGTGGTVGIFVCFGVPPFDPAAVFDDARPRNEVALRQLDRYAVSKETAEKFARARRLVATPAIAPDRLKEE